MGLTIAGLPGRARSTDLAQQSTARTAAASAPVLDQQSALLDGQAFDAAITATTTNPQTPSALLDGQAFDAAITNAITATTTNPQTRSALLDGAAFDAAIADALGR